MNRRSAFNALFKREETAAATILRQQFTFSGDLEPYAGPWTFEQAAHLLRRAAFGPNKQQIERAVELGLNGAIAQLFAEQPLPPPPVNYFFDRDPLTPIGETWIDQPYVAGLNLQGYRRRTLRAWTMGLILNEGISIREKLTLFWHNHFAVSDIIDANFEYIHLSLLREYAWGNFRELIKKMTIDPAMLRFLNGNQNTSRAPNENYARELLELYTIGKGPLAGPGDYTTFTEDDVMAVARVLTGWRDRGYLRQNPDVLPGSFFRANQHDTGRKQLSHRFDHAVVDNGGDTEYSQLIDLIFQQKEVARFICRKWYRWFVYYQIDDEVEVNVIEPMAEMLIAHDFETRPVLEALFSSAHFYDVLNIGPMIKNPIDFLAGPFKQFEVAFSPELGKYYNAWQRFFGLLPLMQMEYLNPPDVAGWKAYYQEPSYYRTWINSTTLPARMAITEKLSDNGYFVNGFQYRIDVLAFVQKLENAGDPNELIQEIARLIYPQPLTEKQVLALKEALIPGLEDYVWTSEYYEYLNDPNDQSLKRTVEARLRKLIALMLSMPEYQLS